MFVSWKPGVDFNWIYKSPSNLNFDRCIMRVTSSHIKSPSVTITVSGLGTRTITPLYDHLHVHWKPSTSKSQEATSLLQNREKQKTQFKKKNALEIRLSDDACQINRQYIYIRTYIYAYIYVCVNILYIYMYVCMSVCLYVCLSVCMHACMHACKYVSKYVSK